MIQPAGCNGGGTANTVQWCALFLLVGEGGVQELDATFAAIER
jgi:hypothetical protein